MFDKSAEQELEEQEAGQAGSPVECLGMTFESDGARRSHFLGLLREKLQEPAFRDVEGFPIAEDDDILALSDPPYYTICPNPWLGDFVRHYSRPYDPANDGYHREPFAADVSEGRSEPVYNAHRYHTKVPPRAIVRYLMHYTEPGDIVLDGFAGTGMVGIAAQACAEPDPDLRQSIEASGTGVAWGRRVPVMVDLSPIATFVAHNQNCSPPLHAYRRAFRAMLDDVSAECGWMYAVQGPHGEAGAIRDVVWSEVLVCASCSRDIVFWDAAVDASSGTIAEEFACPHCKAVATKRQLVRRMESHYNAALGEVSSRARYVPVLIRGAVGRTPFAVSPRESDLATIDSIEHQTIPYWFPTGRIDRDIDMWYERDYRSLGIYSLDSFYTRRNLWVLAALWHRAGLVGDVAVRNGLRFTLTSMAVNLSQMNCWRHGVSFPYNPVSGTLYVSSIPVEANVLTGVINKAKRLDRIWAQLKTRPPYLLSTQSTESLAQVPSDSIDYVFTDPPFGSNIIYSDLSLLYEGWLRCATQPESEAVVHRRRKQGRTLAGYQEIMTRCFAEYRRVLKPGRWLTVVFHNTRNAVWTAIQEALSQAGFVVADVRTLDKQLGSFKQVTAAGAVRRDLVISAYRPNGGLEQRFQLEAGSEEGAWDFVRTHLRQLPVFVSKAGRSEVIAERQNYLLFDRMVAFHVQRGVTVPLSAAELYAGLAQRFPERDGMYFLPEQVAEYDKKRMSVQGIEQLALIITEESSAIQWLRQQLQAKPQTFQEIHPQFMRELGGWQKHERPLELSDLLQDSFLRYDGAGDVPSQIHGYLSSNYREMRNLQKSSPALQAKAKDRWYVPDPNRATDLERLRERGLLREFEEYRASSQRKLKVFRLEAVRAGFRRAWQTQDYTTIIAVAEKIPEDVLQEDPKLLMWYDQALTRTGG